MKVWLHIGAPKTGSSFLQSMMILNRKRLAERGYIYPLPRESEARAAWRGEVSSGHGGAVGIARLLKRHADPAFSRNLVLSSELLLPDLLSPDSVLFHEFTRLQSRGIAVELVGFVREPFGARFSDWGQGVKRLKATLMFDDAINRGTTSTHRILDLLKQCDARHIPLSLRSYDREKKRLWEALLEIIEFPPGDDRWTQPSNRVVNRSLCLAETLLAIEANRINGWSSAPFVADALVKYAPQVEPSGPLVSRESFRSFIHSVDGLLSEINAYLPSSEALFLPAFNEEWSESLLRLQNRQDVHLPLDSLNALIRSAAIGTELKEADVRTFVFDRLTKEVPRPPSTHMIFSQSDLRALAHFLHTLLLQFGSSSAKLGK